MTLDWVKLQVKLIDDERICELVAEKGMAGFGVYMWIVCLMYQRSSHCLTKTQLKTMKLPGATTKTVNQVIHDFGLFRCDEYGHVYSVIDFFRLGTGEEQDDNADAMPLQEPSSSSPARMNKDRDKNTDKELLLHHNHVEGEAEAHHVDDGGGAERQDERAKEAASLKRLEAFINGIPREGRWTEAVVARSGFGPLILRQWKETLWQFRCHIVVNCKVKEVRSVEDAKRYFMFYVANATTGLMLRKALEEYERKLHGMRS